MSPFSLPGNKKRIASASGLLLLASGFIFAAPGPGDGQAPAGPGQPTMPRTFLANGASLARVKQRIAGGDMEFAAASAALRQRADQELKAGPFTIVANAKPRLPPSGDKHDYVSMAPYFWPDPTKKDGLPYIRKDGRVNPERDKYDAPVMRKMTQAVTTLGLAWYLTGEERYAGHAATLLRVWFLDAATRMNPHLNYGQFIPGITEGRGIGIIDTTSFIKLLDAIAMLQGSAAWTKNDQAGMETWFRAYLTWLQTSKNGKEEAAATNNHGTWYDAQAAAYGLFVGDTEAVRQLLEASKTRISRQVEPDGRQPRELTRTKAYDYSVVNLDGLFALATLGDVVGVDLWRFQTADGRGIRQALEWLIPYATGEKKWEQEQITALRGSMLAPLLRRAANAYKEDRYEQLIAKIPGAGFSASTTVLLYPRVK